MPLILLKVEYILSFLVTKIIFCFFLSVINWNKSPLSVYSISISSDESFSSKKASL
jgi:hypothetical protein